MFRCRYRIRYFFIILITFFLLDFFGVFTHMFERDYYTEFHYPLEGDVLKFAYQQRHGQIPDQSPINQYNYTYIQPCKNKCTGDDGITPISPRLVFIIKSSIPHFARRNAIRQTWGYERRLSDVLIRTVFVLGVPAINPDTAIKNEQHQQEQQDLIDIESDQYQDIVQADFNDVYFNNTIKTMMAIKWAVKFCSRSKFYMFVDDDFYVSAKNVLRFVRNPVNYPEYLEEADETLRKLARRLSQSDVLANSHDNSNQDDDNNKNEPPPPPPPPPNVDELKRIVNDGHNSMNSKDSYNAIQKYIEIKEHNERMKNKTKKVFNVNESFNNNKQAKDSVSSAASSLVGRHLLEMELPDNVRLFSGFVFHSSPHRHRTSKWHVSLEEYPWHMWPPYIPAGSYILSREALIDIYYVSMFTKHFRFDDIFLSIVALKAGIEPLHSEEFYLSKAPFYGPHSYRYVIASHGYNDPNEMVKVWSESRAAGHA